MERGRAEDRKNLLIPRAVRLLDIRRHDTVKIIRGVGEEELDKSQKQVRDTVWTRRRRGRKSHGHYNRGLWADFRT